MEQSVSVEKVLQRLADACKDKGHQCYNVGDKKACAIFWELESIFRKIAKTLEKEQKKP